MFASLKHNKYAYQKENAEEYSSMDKDINNSLNKSYKELT
jgi:hypothetical protein